MHLVGFIIRIYYRCMILRMSNTITRHAVVLRSISEAAFFFCGLRKYIVFSSVLVTF